MHLLCSAREQGRRLGVAGVALRSDSWALVSCTVSCRWCFGVCLGTLGIVFALLYLPVRCSGVEVLDSALAEIGVALGRAPRELTPSWSVVVGP